MALSKQNEDFTYRQERRLLFNAINDTNYGDNFLFCYRCDEFLKAPIYTEHIGKYICDDCLHADENFPQNGRLETAMAEYKFPCKYFNKGCPIVTKFNDLLKHQETCNVITNVWKDLHCCFCNYKSPELKELVDHYMNAHNVEKVRAVGNEHKFPIGTFGEDVKMIFLEKQHNLFAMKVTPVSLNEAKCQICELSDLLPQYKIWWQCRIAEEHVFNDDDYYDFFEFCYDAHSSEASAISVDSNANQLKFNSSSVAVDICRKNNCVYVIYAAEGCKNHCFGCLASAHAEGIVCSYSIVKCCENTFTAKEHNQHIKDVHRPVNNALIKRSALDETQPQFINIEENIFRVFNNALTKLYWFGGNWKHTVYILVDDVLFKTIVLEMSEPYQLPDNWNMVYISREEVEEDEFW